MLFCCLIWSVKRQRTHLVHRKWSFLRQRRQRSKYVAFAARCRVKHSRCSLRHSSKVDYCNVAFAGLARCELDRIQIVLPLLTAVQVMRSCAPLPQRCSTTVSDWAGSATVGLASSTAFSVHGWSSGAGNTSCNHQWPRLCYFCRALLMLPTTVEICPFYITLHYINVRDVTLVRQHKLRDAISARCVNNVLLQSAPARCLHEFVLVIDATLVHTLVHDTPKVPKR